MLRASLLVALTAACGKPATTSNSPPAGSAAAPAGSAARAPAADPFADAKGLVVTASEVRLDGKRLAGTPAELVAHPAAIVDEVGELLALDPKRRVDFALAFTDDARADLVLAALAALGPRSGPAPSADPVADGTAMALDEGKMGKRDEPPAGPRAAVRITSLVAGAPTLACLDAPPPPIAGDDERITLALQVGHGALQISLTRAAVTTPVAAAALEAQLREQKAGAFFADREDADLVASPDATGADLTPAIATLCRVGFRSLRAVTPAELAPQIAPRPPEAYHAIGDDAVGKELALLTMGTPPEIDGDLDKMVVRRYLKRSSQDLVRCYSQALVASPTLTGTVTATFTISATGAVSASAATGVDAKVASCIAGVIRGIAFPAPTTGVVKVSYPLTFRPPT